MNKKCARKCLPGIKQHSNQLVNCYKLLNQILNICRRINSNIILQQSMVNIQELAYKKIIVDCWYTVYINLCTSRRTLKVNCVSFKIDHFNFCVNRTNCF